MTAPAGALTVTRSAVLCGGRHVAGLRYSGKEVTVVMNRKAIGRLLPVGYTSGRADGSGRYDAWTARHPMVHTPSDTTIACGLSFDEAVIFLIES